MKTIKPKYAVLLPKDIGIGRASSDVGVIKLHIVEVQADNSLRNPGSDHEFNDLVFSAQWDDRGFPVSVVYAFALAYRDIYQIELREARRMAKLLERVERKHARWTVAPNTFGQWLALTAADLGLGCIRESKHSRGLSSYSENEYFEISLRDLQYAVDGAIDAARKPAEVQS